MAKLSAGWARPMNSRKFHYFQAGEVMALCHKWMFAGGYREDEHDDHAENCAICKRLVKRIREHVVAHD